MKLFNYFIFIALLICLIKSNFLLSQEQIYEENNSWIQLTDSLVKKLQYDQNAFLDTFPELSYQLEHHHQDPSWINFWGTSVNGEEEHPIVDFDLLAFIMKLAGIKSVDKHRCYFHAGVLHTYGYLLSNLQTIHGYKRDRWIRKTIEEGLELPTGVWGPYPENGNFLAHVTFLGANIAFRNENWKDRIKNFDMISPQFQAFDFTQFSMIHIQESVVIDDENTKFEVVFKTDLIPFKRKLCNTDDTYLLVYSIKDSRDSHSKLITLFPVQDETVINLLTQDQGSVEDIRPKYNAYVSDIPAGFQKGFRSIN